MSAILSIFNFAILAAASLPSCPSNIPVSCHNTSAVQNSCCFNSPGGAFMQTQFWDTDPSTGPSNSWTIHGLWYPAKFTNMPTVLIR